MLIHFKLAPLKTALSIAITQKANRNWVALGEQVRSLYAIEETLDLDRGHFIELVIYPALGPECESALKQLLPRKNSAEFFLMTDTARQEWLRKTKEKAKYRGMASVFFNRIKAYAFPASSARPEPSVKEAHVLALQKIDDQLSTYIRDPRVISTLRKKIKETKEIILRVEYVI